MPDRYPGYDVLAKRNSPSWNEKTRQVMDARLALDPNQRRFFDAAEWLTLRAICDRIIPQPRDRVRPAPLAAMVDEKMHNNDLDGFREATLPRMQEAWRRGLAAIEAEARQRRGLSFHALDGAEQDAILRDAQEGKVETEAWGDMPPKGFFKHRLLRDIVTAYYADPHAWNEIGFGGPAAPRGYVRMNFDMRDPWEAAEAHPGAEAEARRKNAHV